MSVLSKLRLAANRQGHEINSFNNFISGWYLDNLGICDELVNYYLHSPNKQIGSVNNGSTNLLVKSSTDVCLFDTDLRARYKKELDIILDEYKKQYPYAFSTRPFDLTEPPNIQHYAPGQAFHQWHTENIGIPDFKILRHLVFMTYLNDVSNGGHTEWYHQGIKIKPEKGLTMIWPAQWMFTHRGTSSSVEKYIITGWLSFKHE